ncbi:MAG: circularly permuted type 2 ATP-grasp protein [Saprospiraceae bacterium]|nr:circularly permuted type 2 ATP-grasp protein [Saprospiraceae bacterium]
MTTSKENQLFESYTPRPHFWDEMATHTEGVFRPHYESVVQFLQQLPLATLHRKEELAKELFMNQGVTFTVYFENEGIERIFPFDIIPRIIQASEWSHIEKGVKQRLKALNKFLKDIYHDQNIIKDGIVPADLIVSCPHFTREVANIDVPFDIYVHIAGIDLIRDSDGTYYVLEDNLRTPSGVSYMMENREVTKRLFPDLLAECRVSSVVEYPILLHRNLKALAPRAVSNPNIVLLTPGIYNSAYYEHTFLARSMGIELVEGRDLVVTDHKVFMKTTRGLRQVDVIYRRVDDEFLDPLVFRGDSLLGVPGLMSAYRKGTVAIVNAVGNGVADDKAIYAYVPDMIKYYLNEEAILKNVPTFRMQIEDDRQHTFNNMHNMVIKRTNESGGYGMVMGNKATEEELEATKKAILEDPRSFIAQPIIRLSTVPCLLGDSLQPRHVDLRPYALCGPNGIDVVPGGLTRVALREGSLVVNSSQGGGSKDTWVLES